MTSTSGRPISAIFCAPSESSERTSGQVASGASWPTVSRRSIELVGGLITYNDVWSGDPLMAYDRVWNVYEAIVDNFGTTGMGARMLAGIFGVSDPPWFLDWEALNVEQVSRLETVEATTGFGCLRADVRDDLPRITAPTLVLRGDRSWDGSLLDENADPSCN